MEGSAATKYAVRILGAEKENVGGILEDFL
jgi:hypothetical protein